MKSNIGYEKAYEEALEKAKLYHDIDTDNTLPVCARGFTEYLFPELIGNEPKVSFPDINIESIEIDELTLMPSDKDFKDL